MGKSFRINDQRRRTSAVGSAVAWGVVVLAVVGCGGSDAATCQVHGQVTYRGQPLSDAVISFFPASGRPIGGPLDDEGRYRVELSPGDYRVVVNAPPILPEGWQEGDPLPSQQPRIPPYYAERNRSGLTATVPSDTSRHELDFPLD